MSSTTGAQGDANAAGDGPTLTLVVPGLLDPCMTDAEQGPPRFPALETLLARSEPCETHAGDTATLLLHLFGITVPEGEDPPVAALCRLAETGEMDRGWWLRADPAHLVADQDKVYLAAAGDLGLSGDEARQLAAEFNRLFAQDGWRLEPLDPQRWYLSLPERPRIRTTSPGPVLGSDIHPHLPRGEEANEWRRHLTEAQMLLHDSPVNQAREARGAVAVNSLWLWGGGRLPEKVERHWDGVWGGGCLERGLAILADIPCGPAPSGAEEWLRAAAGRHLVVLDGLEGAARRGDEAGWRGLVAAFEEQWFQPLWKGSGEGRRASLELHGGAGVCFRLGPRQRRRWWRRRRPLSRYAAEREICP